MHPLLPDDWTSKALRVAMSEDDWRRFEALVRVTASRLPSAPVSQARVQGETLSRLMDAAAQTEQAPGALDWMDWERQKTLRLIRWAV